ncbi:unnamed protein product, partial [Gongylonema pulchrum]|uniref:Fibrous sheath-interacting protein 1 n=1 Tax=Gongylonema pulchrum TaxID=637853 RepID=A0A183E584_9BILA
MLYFESCGLLAFLIKEVVKRAFFNNCKCEIDPPGDRGLCDLRPSSPVSAKADSAIDALINAYFSGKSDGDVHCNGFSALSEDKSAPSRKDSIASCGRMRNKECRMGNDGVGNDDGAHANVITFEENGASAGSALEILQCALDASSDTVKPNEVKQEAVEKEGAQLPCCSSTKNHDSELYLLPTDVSVESKVLFSPFTSHEPTRENFTQDEVSAALRELKME